MHVGISVHQGTKHGDVQISTSRSCCIYNREGDKYTNLEIADSNIM